MGSRYGDPELDAIQDLIDALAAARRANREAPPAARRLARYLGHAGNLRSERDQALDLLEAAGAGRPVEEPEVLRASGDCVCAACGRAYRDHPGDMRCVAREASGRWYAYAHRLCDGTLVKL